jgi:hypothetical protein
MRRPLSDTPSARGRAAEVERRKAAEHLAKLIGPPRKKRKYSLTKENVARWRVEVKQMLGKEHCKWEPYHLVALYLELHLWCYGVEDVLDSKDRIRAVSFARSMVEREHNGDMESAINFIRWAWSSEKGKEKWRRDNGISNGRLHWYKLFKQPSLHVEYRISLERG